LNGEKSAGGIQRRILGTASWTSFPRFSLSLLNSAFSFFSFLFFIPSSLLVPCRCCCCHCRCCVVVSPVLSFPFLFLLFLHLLSARPVHKDRTLLLLSLPCIQPIPTSSRSSF